MTGKKKDIKTIFREMREGMKNTVFVRRKELKQRGHGVIRKHYMMLAFLMVIMMLFGTEFRLSLSGWEGTPLAAVTNLAPRLDIRSLLPDVPVVSPGEVIENIREEALTSGELETEELAGSKALGLTNGVLAQLVRGLASGSLVTRIAQAVNSVTRSSKATAYIFIICSLLWYALIFFFLKNVYSAVIRRAFIVARTYPELYLSDVTWFAYVRKWFSACRVMFLKDIFQTLWNFTIVGGFIKEFSYWAVPYIVAENPAIPAREAIDLSRRMMDGHKMELFKYKVTFWGWHLLSLVTFGISDLVYGNSYRLAAETEFYAELRKECLAEGIEGCEALNDPGLFECLDKVTLAETYFDVVEEITEIYENRFMPEGWRKKVCDWLGIWFYSHEKKKQYDAQEEKSFALAHDKSCMKGNAYPQRLSPLWENRRVTRAGQYSFIRYYTVWNLFLMFISFCFVGWTWEVALHFIQTGQFANRGTLHGPWLPIYGLGGILVLVLCSRFRKIPVLEFFSAIVLCGSLEYFSAWHLENKYDQRWWSYDGYFLNLHGRICAEGLLVFGVGCCVVVYLVAPTLDHMISMINQRIVIIACIILGTIYTVDLFYSRVHPNMAEGAIEAGDPVVIEEATGEGMTEPSS